MRYPLYSKVKKQLGKKWLKNADAEALARLNALKDLDRCHTAFNKHFNSCSKEEKARIRQILSDATGDNN